MRAPHRYADRCSSHRVTPTAEIEGRICPRIESSRPARTSVSPRSQVFTWSRRLLTHSVAPPSRCSRIRLTITAVAEAKPPRLPEAVAVADRRVDRGTPLIPTTGERRAKPLRRASADAARALVCMSPFLMYGCPLSPEAKLQHEIISEVYWEAARGCPHRAFISTGSQSMATSRCASIQGGPRMCRGSFNVTDRG